MNLKSSTIDLLAEYLKAGGKLIFSGTVPDRINGVLSDIVFDGAAEVPSIEDAIELICI